MSVIDKRVSVRQFSEEPVADEDVRSLLRAAMAAPSAGNQQPWSFYVVRDSAMREALAAASPYAGACAKAPVVLVLCMRANVRFASMAPQDMAACAQNILLRATELGLGAVWLGIYPEKDRMEKAQQVLGLEDGSEVFAFIAVGHPERLPEPKGPSRYSEDRIRWV